MEARYIVEIEGSIEELAYTVNERIEDGYEPIGGFFVREYDSNEGAVCRVYYQPMLRPSASASSSACASDPPE